MRSLIPKVNILSAGAAPLVAAFCREIKLRDIIDEMVTWDLNSAACRREHCWKRLLSISW